MATDKEQNKLNVPPLRFPEFEGEWEKCKLGNITTFSTTRIKSTELDCKNYISTENMLQDFQGVVEAKSVPNDTNVISFTSGDILISNIRPYLKKVWKATFNGGCSSDVFVLQAKGSLDKDFLHYVIANDRFINFVMSGAKGVKMPRGDKNQMATYQLSLPSIQEQNKIASLLSLLDKRIATQSKLIEDLKKLKSAISHILFSSKGAIHLSEIANVVMGQSPSSNAYNDQGLGMPLVQGNLDISNGKTTPRLYTAEFNQTTEKGNIILTVRAPVGEVAKATQKVCLGRGVCAIIPHEENMSDFIYQYLTFYKFMWRRYEQGSTFTSINGSDVRNIFCPKIRNVSILTLLDIKINIEERVVKQYQSQKQYMLYQMFI